MGLLSDIASITMGGYYEGGKHSIVNRDFNSAYGSFESTAEPDRVELTKRARWLHENHAIPSNIGETIISNTIASGFKLKSLHPDKNVQAEIEDLYNRRMNDKTLFDASGRLTGVEFERVLMGARMVDGDSAVNYITTTDPINPVKVQGIETSDFDLYATGTQGRDVYSGVEVNALGKAMYYHLASRKPGLKYDVKRARIPAKQMILHMKTENRFSQFRGVSEYKQTIIDLKNFAAYITASVQGARLRAQLPYYVTAQNPTQKSRKDANSATYEQVMEINGQTVQYLNMGEELKQLDPSVMGENARDFLTFITRMIATGRKISYELAMRDYERLSFSASRASILQDNRKFDYEQFLHVANYKNQDFELWLDGMVLSGKMKSVTPAAYFIDKTDFLRKTWIPPARPFVDPLKDIMAVKEELALGLTTLTREAGRKGWDIEALRTEIAQEKKDFEKAGLTYPSYADADTELATRLILKENEEGVI